MDEFIECPVCALHLRLDMDLDEHLYSHKKEYGINMFPPGGNSCGIIVAGSSKTNTGASHNDDVIIVTDDYLFNGHGTQSMHPSPGSATGCGSATGSGFPTESRSATESESAIGSGSAKETWILNQRDLLEAGPSGRRELDKVPQQCTTQREGTSGITIDSHRMTHDEALVTDAAPSTTSHDTLGHHTGSGSNWLQFAMQHPCYVQQPITEHEDPLGEDNEFEYEDAEDENEERDEMKRMIANMTQDLEIWKNDHIRIMTKTFYI
ncbi:uncharacterized protein LOC131213604 [Anopheles bellator]|uniref:uncharacterized protein LOC131213604 n=1 Tax=Anopheles bellator TaxID=139047 RepID=UPI002648BBE6|nr:uncharacterized protein LOC131213604 [Anopheles bellator]